MKSKLFLAFFFALPFLGFSQEYVVEHDVQEDGVKKSLTLIPFQNSYYRSEIDRSLAQGENLKYDELRNKMRRELDRQLFMILKEDFTIQSFLKNENDEDMELLDYIYYSTASSYTFIETGEKVDRGLMNKGQIKEAPIQEGQKYMKTLIHNPSFFTTLEQQKPSDYYLFIGELDILLPQTIEEKEKNRNIYLHYTLYSSNGELIDSGMLSQLIAVKKCESIKDVSYHGFAPLAYQFKIHFAEILPSN